MTSLYASPFQNGSFEENDSFYSNASGDPYFDYDLIYTNVFTGWTVDGNRILWSKFSNWQPPLINPQDGTYYIGIGWYITTSSSIVQTFDTVSGTTYTVTYYLNTINASESVSRRTMTLTVRDNNASGTVLATHSGVATQTGVWEQKSFTFTATSSTSHITVAYTGINGRVLIDNITIETATSSPPIFSNMNSAVYPDDPTGQNLKGIPSQVMVFDSGIQNTGGSPDANTTVLHVGIPTEIDFEQNSLVFQDVRQAIAGATGNVASNYTTITSSGLTCTSCWEYSENSGSGGPWSSTPNTDNDYDVNGKTYLPNVRSIRLSPTGTFADGTSSATGFRFYYKGIVK